MDDDDYKNMEDIDDEYDHLSSDLDDAIRDIDNLVEDMEDEGRESS